jgi:hypothetical protein
VAGARTFCDRRRLLDAPEHATGGCMPKPCIDDAECGTPASPGHCLHLIPEATGACQ